ncbi:hypothetical protein MMC07_007772 [Pseudocyphellaria aurata]|nr:hypothetical protein [Pseudocyphellaria aurata]
MTGPIYLNKQQSLTLDEQSPLVSARGSRARLHGYSDSNAEGTASSVLKPSPFIANDDTRRPSASVGQPLVSSGSTSSDEDSTRTPEPASLDARVMDQAIFRLVFGAILAQYFVAFFDQALVNTIHPVITSEFHSSKVAAWLETAFLLTSTAFQPLAARLSDNIGRRPLHLFSLFVFGLTTAWCAIAHNMTSLIAARAFCGIGAGGVLAMSPIMTNDIVDINVRGTYQAYINLSVGLASACGAAFGGWICDHLGWRWAFGVQVPFILLIFIVAFATTPPSLGPYLAGKCEHTVLKADSRA